MESTYLFYIKATTPASNAYTSNCIPDPKKFDLPFINHHSENWPGPTRSENVKFKKDRGRGSNYTFKIQLTPL